MREAFFVIFVILILLGLTAIRYRKHIAGMIGFARMLKDAKDEMTAARKPSAIGNEKGIALVQCSVCDVWVPQNKARKKGDLFYCSDECLLAENGV